LSTNSPICALNEPITRAKASKVIVVLSKTKSKATLAGIAQKVNSTMLSALIT